MRNKRDQIILDRMNKHIQNSQSRIDTLHGPKLTVEFLQLLLKLVSLVDIRNSPLLKEDRKR